MAETYALREGAFGRVVVLELRDDLVAHAHADTQFAFWLGGGRSEANLTNGKVEYSEEVALGANAYESHDTRLVDKSQPAVFLVLYISKEWLDAKRAVSGQPFFFSKPQIPISQRVRQSCWRVLDVVMTPQKNEIDRLEQEVEELITSAIDATLAPLNPKNQISRVPFLDHRLRSAIAYMRSHVAEPITVEDMAGRVGLSRTHFFTLFRDQLNTTPQVFWSAVRVEEVVRRLMFRNEPLTSVALELGFSSPGNFSRFFKEHMGVSPSTFRRVAAVQTQNPITGIATSDES
jgi:AraC-like DNA-binding protein